MTKEVFFLFPLSAHSMTPIFYLLLIFFLVKRNQYEYHSTLKAFLTAQGEAR